MKILVWHAGRRGAGPRFAVELARGLEGRAGVSCRLALPEGADILHLPGRPADVVTFPTYASRRGLIWRWLCAPGLRARLDRALAASPPDLAICAMPALLDPIFLHALRRRGIPTLMIAHDARPHAGDGGAMRAAWDRAVLRRADAVAVLSRHVGAALSLPAPVLHLSHPPFPMPPAPPPLAHGGGLRVLSFGRMRAYKDLRLLAQTLRLLPKGWDMRVVGQGSMPAELVAVPGIRLENRFVAEAELPALFAWADVLLLTHREASQSGVAAMALGAGRFVVATAMGGLAEQLGGMPGVFLCPPDAETLATALRALPGMAPPAPVDADAAWAAMAECLLTQIRAIGLGCHGAWLP